MQVEHDLPDDDLKHDPAKGGRKWDGLAVNGDAEYLDTQVAANKLVTRAMPMQVTGLSHPSFFAHLQAAPGTRACHLFSPGEGR